MTRGLAYNLTFYSNELQDRIEFESFGSNNLCQRTPEFPQCFQNLKLLTYFLQLLREHMRSLKYSFSGSLPRPMFPVTWRQLHPGHESS